MAQPARLARHGRFARHRLTALGPAGQRGVWRGRGHRLGHLVCRLGRVPVVPGPAPASTRRVARAGRIGGFADVGHRPGAGAGFAGALNSRQSKLANAITRESVTSPRPVDTAMLAVTNSSATW